MATNDGSSTEEVKKSGDMNAEKMEVSPEDTSKQPEGGDVKESAAETTSDSTTERETTPPEPSTQETTPPTDNPPSSSEDTEKSEEPSKPVESVDFKLMFNKQKYDVTFPLDEKVTKLRDHLEKLTGVPSSMQKIMFKGKMKDEETLRQQKVIKGSKIMLIGSTVNDVIKMSSIDHKAIKEEEKKEREANKEPMSKQKPHKTVLEKHGKPDYAMPGIKSVKEPLPSHPVEGMYNKSGGKVRLTFKLEADQLWLGTKERTEKLPLGSIKAVVNEAIDGHEEYHMMGLQLGPTEASRYWIYWVPAQYVDAIKDAILGKWQFF